ncbi:hypothetical protein IL099_002998 [Enterococcus hirae]|nr:hypothetical protein [Enterococcus hirae]
MSASGNKRRLSTRTVSLSTTISWYYPHSFRTLEIASAPVIDYHYRSSVMAFLS